MENIENLESIISGRVIGPADEDYDEACVLFYGGHDRRPGVVIRPANTADVAKVVAYAATHGVDLAVKSGGHSPAGHSVIDGGIVVDLSDMRAHTLEHAGQTIWAETGLRAAELTNILGEHDLAITLGDTGSVGIGGITQAGGAGFMLRKYGLTIDSVVAAEIVTADGQVRVVNEHNEPDLFWAVRGGAGNFGLVTRFQYRLQSVPEAYGGMLILPATPAAIAGFMSETAAAPEEVTTMLNVMVAPPMPMIPPEHHGSLIALGLILHVGPGGEAATAPLRKVAEPLSEMLQPMKYPEIYQEEEAFHPVAYGHTLFMDGVDEAVATSIIEGVQKSTAMMSVVNLRALGGAYGRVSNDATAYAHRSRAVMGNVAAIFADPDERSTHVAWVEDLAGTLAKGDNSGYVGFLGDEGPGRVRAAYPGATWDRLRQIKGRYDPDNLFRHCQNIPPI